MFLLRVGRYQVSKWSELACHGTFPSHAVSGSLLGAPRHSSEHRVLNGSNDILQLKDYAVELLSRLSWIDADGFPNPVQVGAADLG